MRPALLSLSPRKIVLGSGLDLSDQGSLFHAQTNTARTRHDRASARKSSMTWAMRGTRELSTNGHDVDGLPTPHSMTQHGLPALAPAGWHVATTLVPRSVSI
jgi:hypothetical protein